MVGLLFQNATSMVVIKGKLSNPFPMQQKVCKVVTFVRLFSIF
jgi:hypothetical protein